MEDRQNDVVYTAFPKTLINRDHIRDFGAYWPVPDTLARPRIGWPWACNARGRYLSSHRGERRPRRGQKQESTYVRSVPLREDTTDSVPSKGVSFRVVSGASVTPGVVSFYLPASPCLHSVSAHVTRGRCARRSVMFIAPKSHYSRWVSTRCAGCELRDAEMLGGLVVGSYARANRRIHASVGALRSRRRRGTRKSGSVDARTCPLSREEKIRLDIAAVLY